MSENEAVTGARTLEVTQEDIDGARRNSAWKCPFARAARRLFPGWDFVTATGLSIQLQRGGPDWAVEEWDTDEAGQAAVMRYDRTGEMVPGSYTLTLRSRR